MRSADGTTIAFECCGDGPPLLLVDGALCCRETGPSRPLAVRLADRFTVYSFDRRGRGYSGDTAVRPPHSPVDREVEDIAAVLHVAGGPACVYGSSSGAALVMHAAAAGVPMARIALYESPFAVGDECRRARKHYVREMQQALAADHGAEAVRLFLRHVGVPGFSVTLMRFLPAWPKLVAVASTLPNDAAALCDTDDEPPLSPRRWASVRVPALVLGGARSPTWMLEAVRATAAALPDAQLGTLDGQTHMVTPTALAPALADFFVAGPARLRQLIAETPSPDPGAAVLRPPHRAIVGLFPGIVGSLPPR